MTRIAILWDSFPSYISKCVETLAQQEKVEIFAYCRSEGAFPNVLDQLRRYPNIRLLDKDSHNLNSEQVFNECCDFRPDLAVITLTRRGLYARIASAYKKFGAMVIGTSDHFWQGDWRDYANFLSFKLNWFSPYEGILVPGILGKKFARKIGFPEQVIFDGLYTCDTDIFQPIGRQRHDKKVDTDWPPVFLYVGQFSYRKGLDILLKAYGEYRQQASKPWELWLIGRGELEKHIGEVRGVRNLGPKTSSEVAAIMQQAGCFVIPSRVDHWPLVIHEATSAGLPVIASNMCGSTIELVQSSANGYVFPSNYHSRLSRLLLLIAESGLARVLGKNSLHLSYRFSPEIWSRRILNDIPLILRGQLL